MELKNLSFEEKMDFFIGVMSANFRSVELSDLLAMVTSQYISSDLYMQNFSELSSEEVQTALFNWLNGTCNEEGKAWRIIIATLGCYKVLDILESEDYITQFTGLNAIVEQHKHCLNKYLAERIVSN